LKVKEKLEDFLATSIRHLFIRSMASELLDLAELKIDQIDPGDL